MQEEQEPIQTNASDPEPAPAEPRPGKKSKADKKKLAATTRAETESPPVEPESQPTGKPELEPAPAISPLVSEKQTSTARDPFEQGIQCLLRGAYAEAENLYSQALTLRQQAGDRAGQVQVLEQLGHLAFLRGETQSAQEYYRQASALRRV